MSNQKLKIVPYVVGLMFSPTQECPAAVALIRKNRPGWQAGRLNGPGGHIEGKETMQEAMEREFLEETGAKIHASEWEHFATLVFDNVTSIAHVHFLKTFSQAQLRSVTDEKVEWHQVVDLEGNSYGECVGHLSFLIPMALKRDQAHIQILEAGEAGAPRSQGEEDAS